jgi:hypothetical protein
MHLPEVFLRRALAIEASGINFLVAMLLEDVEDGRGLFKGVDTGLFNTRLEPSVSGEVPLEQRLKYLANGHSPKDNLDICFFRCHLEIYAAVDLFS